jgi:hypothetical protein
MWDTDFVAAAGRQEAPFDFGAGDAFRYGGKQHHRGALGTEEEAAWVYGAAAAKHHAEFATLPKVGGLDPRRIFLCSNCNEIGISAPVSD